MVDFGQKTTPVGAIKGILGIYPYSVGLLRELLQNSDDAKASKQIFILDRKEHTTSSLYHPGLATTQGPALLAYNDANFESHDWDALEMAYESSKATDSSKIGKYGVGFRSVFHITDCPQIVSGKIFAFFDPQNAFTALSGGKLDLSHLLGNNPGQLAPFISLFPQKLGSTEFNGTVIRCPLRRQASHISNKVIRPDGISSLMNDFIAEEIEHSLLFLQHVQHIEIRDINEHGILTSNVQVGISRLPLVSKDKDTETFTAIVSINANGTKKDTIWRVIRRRFQPPVDENVAYALKQHKLLPNVDIAIPVSVTAGRGTYGRLFTFLPLPLRTGFPTHIHAYFALAQSRQNLRNPHEIGLGEDDKILTEWNKLLFSDYIPRAWKELIEILVGERELEDIFDAWPPEQQLAPSGESLYWGSLPARIVTCAIGAHSRIWPVYQLDQSPQALFASLDDLIVADAAIPSKVLESMTRVGLRFTRPPQYIVHLIKKATLTTTDTPPTILSPEVAHRHLLDFTVELHKASREDVDVILEYLLSTGKVHNIVGLPVIRLVNDDVVALSLIGVQQQSTSFTLFSRSEYDVFWVCDERAIPLHLLPRKAADIIRTHGPETLNVETLAVPHIVRYLTGYSNKLDLDFSPARTDLIAVEWLSVFWMWQSTYARKAELYEGIKHLPLLPSSRGLRRADSPLFLSRRAHLSRDAHLTLVQCLLSLGIPFLDDRFSQHAQPVLTSSKLLKNIADIHAVLDALDLLPSNPPITPRRDECSAILTHLSINIPVSVSKNGNFTPEQTRRLKCLPIYPVVEISPRSLAVITEYRNIPDDSQIRAVNPIPPFLPSVRGMIFLNLECGAMKIMDYIGSSDGKGLSNVDLLSLTVQSLLDQPDHAVAATLQYMVANRRQIPRVIEDTLQKTAFVTMLDGSRRKPKEIADPNSVLAPLYVMDLTQRPRTETPSERSIVQALSSLKLMKHILTIDIVQDIIEKIALDSSQVTLSRALLKVIVETHLDYRQLLLTPEHRWLPTSNGLRGYTECRDTAQSPPHLFDQVLAVLERPFELPSSLRQILQWDNPLSVEVLIEQLEHILDAEGNQFSVVLELIKQIGSRCCTNEQLEPLRRVTRDKNWVPTNTGQLSDSRSAIFSLPTPDSGFSQIQFVDQNTQNLLHQMGCFDRPSTSAVISKLISLSQEPMSLHTVNLALGLIRCLGSELTDEDRSQLLVPDANGILRAFSATFFNDIGTQVKLVPLSERFLCHPLIDESLAQRLRIGRLGLEYAGLATPSIDMGEKPVVTVRKTLKEYTEKQFLTEFLANAADAHATEFTLIVNHVSVDSSQSLSALSPEMAKFCTAPSLVAHNNAKFTERDFTGICRTSVGGKQRRSGTIGQFGLGALTMFHFTELAIVVSDSSVLFLNPSKGHLPIRDSAALMLPLNHVKTYYSSHLMPIHGLFGFDISTDEAYDGTIFLLPLREGRHCEGSVDVISYTYWTPAQVENSILAALHDSAPNCLIFTELDRINGGVRSNQSAEITLSWKFEAKRIHIDTEVETGFMITDTTVTNSSGNDSYWKVVNTSRQNLLAQVPDDLSSFMRNLRAPFAGLAMLFESSSDISSFNFFSAFPLGISSSLPIHVNASFILASDRRSIRLDDDNRLETRYNKWLLTQVIPQLYYFLLARSLHLGDQTDNKRWWPKHDSHEDQQSRFIVQAFYENMRHYNRRIFRSFYLPYATLTTQEVVISCEESQSIQAVIQAIQPNQLARLPKRVYSLAKDIAGISTVTPEYLRVEILQDYTPVQSLNSSHLEHLIGYLSRDSLDNLDGLHILPLDDESFGPINTLPLEDGRFPYFVWTPKRPHNFPSRYFVHRKLKAPALLKLGINVEKLSPPSMTGLIEECLDASSDFETLPIGISNWIGEFWSTWEEYALLGLRPEHIRGFPLVPTIYPNVFVSLDLCKNGPIMLMDGSLDTDDRLRACLSELGLPVVRLDHEPTPDTLRRILQSSDYPKLSISGVLSGLSLLENISRSFADIDVELQEAFATWARREITGEIAEHIEIARQLPIWFSVKNGSQGKLRAASEIFMLPNTLPIQSTGRFMRCFVASYGSLRYLTTQSQNLTLEDVEDSLELPPVMDATDIRDYRDFLRVWLPLLPDSNTGAIRVPNSNGLMTLSSGLYSKEPLFEAAFGQDSHYFVAQELDELQPLLKKHELRHQLDLPTFRICAQAINDREDEGRADRAEVLYDAYCTLLPMHINPHDRDVWHELDELSFIPRKIISERRLDGSETETGLGIPSSIIGLPSVVSPLDVVRKEFEAVAWTQKALLNAPPHNRILVAYPNFGRPDVSDVIRHLKALSSLAKSHTSAVQRRTIIHDLSKTYTFLNDNISRANEEELSQLKDDTYFLNVNDPTEEEWHWDECEHLVFETHDTDGSFRYVRTFLKPFSKLLQGVGVLEVYHHNYDFNQAPNSDVSKSEALRKGFDVLRKKNYLTDVVFIVGDAGDCEDLAPPVAHRSFLAVVSQHFTDSFCEGYAESRTASQQDPVKVLVPEYSRECVQSVLDYIYTGIKSLEGASLELLVDIMRLSSFWRIVDLSEDMEKQIIMRKLITPLTLDYIKEAAETANGETLAEACRYYEERNMAFIIKVRQNVV